MKQKYPFLQTTSFTEEYVAQNYWKYNFHASYWLMLPNNVKPHNLNFLPSSVPMTQLIGCGQYRTVDSTACLNVEVHYQPFDRGNKFPQPAEWLLSKFKWTDHVILEKKQITTASGIKVVDVLTSRPADDGGTIITRWTATRKPLSDMDDSAMDYFVICAFCKAEDYNELSETIRYITSHWGTIRFNRKWEPIEYMWDI